MFSAAGRHVALRERVDDQVERRDQRVECFGDLVVSEFSHAQILVVIGRFATRTGEVIKVAGGRSATVTRAMAQLVARLVRIE